MIFLKEYKPKKIKKTNVFASRKKIFGKLNKNLTFLLNKRFNWMHKIVRNKKIVIELGSGNGCIKKFVNNKIILTDIVKFPWIDKKIDMSKINLGKKFIKKVDAFIINHSLHHCANPSKALSNILPYLKKGGKVIINEPEASFFLRLVQVLLDDEGFSFNVNVFKKKNIFNPKSPWISNTAIANLLFKDEKNFIKHFPQFKIKKNKLSEFIIFLNSGGVNTNVPRLPLNNTFLKFLNIIDIILIFFFPNIFALNRSVVLEKIN